jgi:hypothetical protein
MALRGQPRPPRLSSSVQVVNNHLYADGRMIEQSADVSGRSDIAASRQLAS